MKDNVIDFTKECLGNINENTDTKVENNLYLPREGFSGVVFSDDLLRLGLEEEDLIEARNGLKLDLVSAFNQGLDVALEVLGQFYINDETQKAEENNDFIDMLILEIGKYYN